MNEITLAITPELMSALGISANADKKAVGAAIVAIAKKAEKLEQVQGQLSSTKLELDAFKLTAVKKDVNGQLEAAFKEKRITVEFKEELAEQYAEKPEELKKILAKMPAFQSVLGHLEQADAERSGGMSLANMTPQVKALFDKGFKTLHKEGKLGALQAASNEAYLALYQAEYGYLPNEKPFQQGKKK